MSSLHHVPFTLILPTIIGYYYFRELGKTGSPRLYGIAVVTLVVVMGWSGWVISQILSPGVPLARAELHTTTPPLLAPAYDGHLSLLVQGKLKSSQSESVSGTYELEVSDDADHNTHIEGKLDTHLKEQKVGWSGVGKVRVDHLEERLDLPPQMVGHEVKVKLTRVEGELRVPLEVSVIPSPPTQGEAATLGIAFILMGAVLDSRNKQTYFTLCIAILASFTTLMCKQVTPDGSSNPVLGATLAALFMGMSGGALTRWGVAKILPSRTSPG